MASSYFFTTIESFDQDSHGVPRHVDAGMGIDDPSCEYKRVASKDLTITIAGNTELVLAYEVRFEKRIHKSGRFSDQWFDWYYEPHNFLFYRVPTLNVVVFTTGKDTVKSFIKTMKRDPSSTLRLKQIDLNLAEVSSRIEILKGAWVGGLTHTTQFLSTQAFFGNHVNQSNDFQNAVAQGELGAINFTHNHGVSTRQTGISRHGAIYIAGRIENNSGNTDIRMELAFILDVYQKYIIEP